MVVALTQASRMIGGSIGRVLSLLRKGMFIPCRANATLRVLSNAETDRNNVSVRTRDFSFNEMISSMGRLCASVGGFRC